MKFLAKIKTKLTTTKKINPSNNTGLKEEMVTADTGLPIPSSIETPKQDHSKYLHQESIPPFSTPSEQKSSIFGTSSNLVNTIVGAGIIGIPYAILQCGIVAGTALLILVGILTEKSLRMLIDTSVFNRKFYGRNVETFEDLMYYPFGVLGRGYILLSMFVMAYGAMVAYLIIIKDTVPVILGFDEGFQPELVLIVTSLLIILPLSMQRDMASLACTSLFSVTCDIMLVVFMVVFAPVLQSISDWGGLWEIIRHNAINPHLFVGLGILSTAMCCQHSGFLIYGSLLDNNRARWGKVTNYSISTSTILTYTLGLAGYLGFMEYTQGDVLNNFPAGSLQANVARMLLAITMFLTYPMESFVGRHVVVDLIHNGDMDGPDGNNNDSPNRLCIDRMLFNRRERMTIILYFASLIPALIFDDLGPVLSVTGCIGGSSMAYIGPGLAFLGVNCHEFLEWAGSLLPPRQCIDVQHTVQSDLTLPNHPHIPKGRKPIWWYLFGFPIWCHICEIACEGMHSRLSVDQYKPEGGENLLPPPTKYDFLVAMFFVVFGLVALVAGLISNVVLQTQ